MLIKLYSPQNNSPFMLLHIYYDMLHPLDVIILRQLASKIMNT